MSIYSFRRSKGTANHTKTGIKSLYYVFLNSYSSSFFFLILYNYTKIFVYEIFMQEKRDILALYE